MLCDWEGKFLACAWLVINTACHVIKYLSLSLGRGAGGWSLFKAWRGTSGTSCQLFEGPIQDNSHSFAPIGQLRVTSPLNVFPVWQEVRNMQTLHIKAPDPAGPTEALPFIKYSVQLKQLNPKQTAWANVVISQTSVSKSRVKAKFVSGATRGWMVSTLHSCLQALTVFTSTSVSLGGASCHYKSQTSETDHTCSSRNHSLLISIIRHGCG